jgi:hypothetical protein
MWVAYALFRACHPTLVSKEENDSSVTGVLVHVMVEIKTLDFCSFSKLPVIW